MRADRKGALRAYRKGAGVEVSLHRGNRIAHQTKSHMVVRRALMLYHHVNISRPAGGPHRPQHVRIPGAQILIDKTRRLQPQGSEIAPLADRFGKIEHEEIIRCLRVAKKSFKDRIMRR